MHLVNLKKQNSSNLRSFYKENRKKHKTHKIHRKFPKIFSNSKYPPEKFENHEKQKSGKMFKGLQKIQNQKKSKKILETYTVT